MMRTTLFKKLLTTGSLALLLAQSAMAQIHMGGPDPAPKELVLPDGGVAVPMLRHNAWAVVEAKINDQGPYRFVIDTGAPGVFLSKWLADELKLSEEKTELSGVQVRVAGPGGEGRAATLHSIQTLKIGAAELRGLRALSLDLPFSRQIAGILGMGVFRDCLLTLDYPAGKVKLERGELPAANGRDILEFTQPRQRASHPVLKVEVCGEPVEFTLDTGMVGWFRFPKKIADRCAYAYGPVDGPKGRTVDREIATRVARLNGQLKFGEYVVENPHGAVTEETDIAALIGGRFLENFALALDQKHNRIRFARDDKKPLKPPAMRTPGFSLRPESDGLRVWHVLVGSPAERAGLKVGDTVVALMGKPADEIYGWPQWEKLLNDGRAVQVRYKPDGRGEPREVEVSIMDLVP